MMKRDTAFFCLVNCVCPGRDCRRPQGTDSTRPLNASDGVGSDMVWRPLDSLGAVLELAGRRSWAFVVKERLAVAIMLVVAAASIGAIQFHQHFTWASILSVGEGAVTLGFGMFLVQIPMSVR